MKEFITPHSIANTIRMMRSQFDGVFLIVEGDTDARFYKNFFNQAECKIQNAYNKQKAIEALMILEADSFSGVLAIVDADFDILEGNIPTSHNLLLTDFHDVECLIFNSPALDKVLSEFGSEEKIRNFEASLGKHAKDAIIDAAQILGYLRWVSLLQNLGLRFEELSFDKFTDEHTLVVDLSKLIKTIKNHSQKPAINDVSLVNSISEQRNDNHHPLQISCGHDLVAILHFALRRAIGSMKTTEVRREYLASSLRLAFEFAHFASTKLYELVKEWERINQVNILRSDS